MKSLHEVGVALSMLGIMAMGVMNTNSTAIGQGTAAKPKVRFFASSADSTVCPVLVPVPLDHSPWAVEVAKLLEIANNLDRMSPFNPDSASQIVGEALAQGSEDSYGYDVVRANFDGEPPFDYCVNRYYPASIYPYESLLIIRNPKSTTVQAIGGERRGLANLYGEFLRSSSAGINSLADSLRRADSAIDKFLEMIFRHVVDADGDGCDDYLAHVNVYFISHKDNSCLQAFEEWYETMAGITDFPVPYFWDGSKLTFILARSREYYRSIRSLLSEMRSVHSCLLRSLIAQFLESGKLRPCPGSDW